MHADIEPYFDLTDRVAVVTGAGGGIGRSVALTLARAGAAVLVSDADPLTLTETVALVGASGGAATGFVADVSRRTDMEDLATAARDRHGRIDVWANVAGVIRYGAVADMPEEEVDLLLDVNLRGTYWGCASAVRAMSAQGAGSIVNVASSAIDLPTAGIAGYSLTKAAVAMLTRSLAVEVGPQGIRVNAVAPGWVDTPMVAHHWTTADGAVDEEARREVFARRAAVSPLGITGEPVDIALAVLYLAADASRFVTGQVLRPNGGAGMPG
ncbi:MULTISPECIES: SDR family NAD(P)-dependent oxidoreductase [Microbacterium]|uniref:SDR family NAD(P)-dependent oxidoreductase n=1 Tax=Microbacterium TaxID=33882 RepID=UPI00301013D4